MGTVIGVVEHPAARAWRTLRGGRAEPARVVTIRERPKAAIFRLDGVGPRGAPVIAKRCDARTGLVERQVYERILPRTSVAALHYYGHAVADDGSCWLFLEYAEGARFAPEKEEHRVLAARWLARVHGPASRIADARRLPDRGPAHYLDHLRAARLTIAGCLASGSALTGDRALLESVIAQCDVVEARWAAVDAWCAEMPRTLVHGDFRPKNVHVRSNGGSDRLLVMDWETAGWGEPAADVASVRGPRGELAALEAYVATARDWWPTLDVRVALRMVSVGKLFRRLAAIRWCSVILPHRREKSIAVMSVHRAELAAIIEEAGWT